MGQDGYHIMSMFDVVYTIIDNPTTDPFHKRPFTQEELISIKIK